MQRRHLARATTTFAAACPVCFGAADGPMIDASIAGMLTMIAVTLVVLCAIAGVALSIARRARAAAKDASPVTVLAAAVLTAKESQPGHIGGIAAHPVAEL